MADDFETADHGLNKLKVATRGGVGFRVIDPQN